MPGRIRVGRSKYVNSHTIYPSMDGFTQIPVLTQVTNKEYGDLGPYNLKNEHGQIMENCWQNTKIYPKVPACRIPYSSGNPTIVWEWAEEIHIDSNGNPTPEYWNWRHHLLNNPYPVRNPVPWSYMKTCAYALEKFEPISESNPKLNYIEGRCKIYVPTYITLVSDQHRFKELKSRLEKGENLLIIEVDGPHQESLSYYQSNYGVSNSWIQQDSIEATIDNLSIMLNDSKHPFGHGYCLAWALQL